MSEIIKTYKGFKQDMTCRGGFQYEEGKEYETDRACVCECGFHGCEHPLDVLEYYLPSESVFHEVEQSGQLSRHNEDTKVASTKIKIGKSISIAGMVRAAIKYTKKRAAHNGASSATGRCGVSFATWNYGVSSAPWYRGVSSATGHYGASYATDLCGASSATGRCGASSATGIFGASSATGICGASSATGRGGASSATGRGGASSATGDNGASSAIGPYGASSATGWRGASSAAGHCGASSATGIFGASSSENAEAIAVAWGYKSKAKGVLGAYLVFADWECTKLGSVNPDGWTLKEAKMVQVDGDKIKPDTWYRIENGEIIEVEE